MPCEPGLKSLLIFFHLGIKLLTAECYRVADAMFIKVNTSADDRLFRYPGPDWDDNSALAFLGFDQSVPEAGG